MKKLILVLAVAFAVLGGGIATAILDSSPAYADPSGDGGGNNGG